MKIGDLEIVNPDLERAIERLRSGEMDEFAAIDLFNYLICYGLLWHMGPRWIETGCNFIRDGYCVLPCAGQC